MVLIKSVEHDPTQSHTPSYVQYMDLLGIPCKYTPIYKEAYVSTQHTPVVCWNWNTNNTPQVVSIIYATLY